MSDVWVALLRGINVGGHHKVPMADLRELLARVGFTDVRTYIQSGNVVFRSPEVTGAEPIAAAISDAIDAEFGFRVPVVARPLDEIVHIAESHPGDRGDVAPTSLLVVVLDGDTDADAQPDPEPFEPDRWTLGPREVYVTYPNGQGRSKLTIDRFERAFGVTAAARNLNTLRAIVELGRALGD